MQSMPRQLIFNLDPDPRFGEDDFLIAPSNQRAWSMVLGWPDWADRGLLLCGPSGSGKSHIGAIWAGRADAVIVKARDLDGAYIGSLAPGSAVLVEDVDAPGVREEHVFHLLNTMRERGLWLLATADRGPGADWPAIADLASRLRALPRADLEPPGDELVRAVLVKLFMDRQLAVDTEVVDFLARRIERSLGAARRVVAEIDAEGLALGRRVTRPIASAVLARFEVPED